MPQRSDHSEPQPQAPVSRRRASVVPVAADRIDIHCHLLPGIDDGCRDSDESRECIRRLKAAGFVGSICTPHMWPDAFPANTPENIRAMVARFDEELRDAGIDYRVWPGGELRLFEGVIPWLEKNGVPTLGDSNFVLVDFWDKQWPRFANAAFEWLIKNKYQPILAHPERIPASLSELDKKLREVEEMGVLLQGNARSFTGGEGMAAGQIVRMLMQQNRYAFLAMDMHRPESLNSRLDGLALAEVEFGQKAVDYLIIQAPRRIVKIRTPE